MNLVRVTAILVVMWFYAEPNQKKAADSQGHIRIVEATFGDQLNHKTCTPDLSLCKVGNVCKFTVGEMCKIDSDVKNLEVTWDCGEGTPKKSKAAAKGTEILISCSK